MRGTQSPTHSTLTIDTKRVIWFRMTQAERIIRTFGDWRGRGGAARLAALLGHRNPSTVGGWMRRGSIPVWHWPAVRAAAAGAGIVLTNDDFFPPAAEVAGGSADAAPAVAAELSAGRPAGAAAE